MSKPKTVTREKKNHFRFLDSLCKDLDNRLTGFELKEFELRLKKKLKPLIIEECKKLDPRTSQTCCDKCLLTWKNFFPEPSDTGRGGTNREGEKKVGKAMGCIFGCAFLGFFCIAGSFFLGDMENGEPLMPLLVIGIILFC